MTYVQIMELPFAILKRDAFYEHNFLLRHEQLIALDKFLTQDELVARYYAEINEDIVKSNKKKFLLICSKEMLSFLQEQAAL